MISFGDCKNSIYLLKTTLKKMGYFQNDPCMPFREFEQQKFRADNDNNGYQNNRIMLQLLNFILLDYCTDIYKQLLQLVPNLKFKNDQGFVQSSISIARDYFNVVPGITCQQFLSTGYLNKKLQFIANLTKSVYNKAQAIKKSKNKEGKKELKQTSQPFQFSFQSGEQPYPASTFTADDSEEQVPMKITALPMKINFDQIKTRQQISKPNPKSIKTNNFFSGQPKQLNKGWGKFEVDGQKFDQHQIQRALEERHPTPISAASKPEHKNKNKIESGANKFYNEHDSLPLKDQSKYAKYKIDDKKNKIPHPHQYTQQSHTHGTNKNEPIHEPAEDKFVSKQEFAELVGLVKIVSETVNQVSIKFGQLQNTVSTQINNLNARVLMLQSTVRLLKDNL